MVYPAVAGVILVWAGIAAVSRLIRPWIPAPEPNAAMQGRGRYAEKAALQPVKWRASGRAAFLEARRLGRPLLLCVGRSESQLAASLDEELFRDAETAEAINRWFIPVRIDLYEEPVWQDAFLPISRRRSAMLPGFELAVLDSEGRLIDWTAAEEISQKLDAVWLGDFLVRARRKIERGDRSMQESQLAEARGWTSGELIQPDAALYFSRSARPSDTLAPEPWEIHALLSHGRVTEAEGRCLAILRSQLPDWVGGGFFSAVQASPQPAIDSTKSLSVWADTVAAFARVWAATRRPALREAALWRIGSIDDFQHKLEIVLGCSYEVTVDGRVTGVSIPLAALNQSLNQRQRRFAENQLNLKVSRNPLMAPWMEDPEAALGERDALESTLQALMAGRPRGERNFGDVAGAEALAGAAARCFEVALLLDSPAALEEGKFFWQSLRLSRAGDVDLDRNGTSLPGRRRFLTDYLAYAEASLYAGMALQDPSIMDRGLKVLERGLSLFRGEDGRLVMADDIEFSLLAVPRWSLSRLDGASRSGEGLAVRTLSGYAALYRRKDFAELAQSILWDSAGAAALAPSGLGGLLDAAGRSTGEAEIYGGPDAVARWRSRQSLPGANAWVDPRPEAPRLTRVLGGVPSASQSAP